MQSTSDSPVKSPVTFRKAGPEDVIPISRLLREFHAKSGAVYKIPYDHESMLVLVDDVVRRGVCLVGPTSCAGAIFRAFPSNCAAVIAYVPFWYFQKKREIAIFEALIKACRVAGATHINVASLYPKNTVARFYRRCGLYPVESQFLGRIG